MKNLLIAVLLAGLAVSVYLNFRKPVITIPPVKPQLLGDSLQINFFQNTTPFFDEKAVTDPAADADLHPSAAITSCKTQQDNFGNVCLRSFCCPVMPREDTSQQQPNYVDVNKLKAIIILSLKKRP